MLILQFAIRQAPAVTIDMNFPPRFGILSQARRDGDVLLRKLDAGRQWTPLDVIAEESLKTCRRAWNS